jgi:hypothetical protein
MAAIGGGRRPAGGRHAQHLAGARDVLVIHPRHPVRARDHAHFLQHIAVVIDAGLVEADRGVDAALLEGVGGATPLRNRKFELQLWQI